jgi:hypothetical protein
MPLLAGISLIEGGRTTCIAVAGFHLKEMFTYGAVKSTGWFLNGADMAIVMSGIHKSVGFLAKEVRGGWR